MHAQMRLLERPDLSYTAIPGLVCCWHTINSLGKHRREAFPNQEGPKIAACGLRTNEQLAKMALGCLEI